MNRVALRMFQVLVAGLVGAGVALSAQQPTQGYNSAWRNADGSEKLALEFGAGYDVSAGATRHYQTRGWNAVIGGGYNLNKRIGVLAEYSFNDFKVPASAVDARFGQPPFAGSNFVTGNVHLWSLTVEPTYHFYNASRVGGYVVGGGGFYRKLVSFEQAQGSCAGNQPCGASNVPFYHVSDNAPGANLGVGFAFRILPSSNAKFFAEARYTWVDNQPSANKSYAPVGYRAGYFPVTGGVRW